MKFYILTGCEIDLDDKTLKKTNKKGTYPLIVNATGDIIYPVGEKKLKFGKMLIPFLVTIIIETNLCYIYLQFISQS